jgi:hypothetical protein
VSNTGGIFYIQNSRVELLSAAFNIRLAVSENAESWNRIIVGLKGIEKRLIDIYVLSERGRFENAIQQMRSAVAALERHLRSLQS